MVFRQFYRVKKILKKYFFYPFRILAASFYPDPWLPPAGFASTGKFRKFHSELAQTFVYQRVVPLFPFVLLLFGDPIRYVSSAKYRKKNRSVQRLRL